MTGNINHCLACCEQCIEELNKLPGCEDILTRCEELKATLIATRDRSSTRAVDWASFAMRLFTLFAEFLLKKQQMEDSKSSNMPYSTKPETDPVQAAATKGFNSEGSRDAMGE